MIQCCEIAFSSPGEKSCSSRCAWEGGSVNPSFRRLRVLRFTSYEAAIRERGISGLFFAYFTAFRSCFSVYCGILRVNLVLWSCTNRMIADKLRIMSIQYVAIWDVEEKAGENRPRRPVQFPTPVQLPSRDCTSSLGMARYFRIMGGQPLYDVTLSNACRTSHLAIRGPRALYIGKLLLPYLVPTVHSIILFSRVA